MGMPHREDPKCRLEISLALMEAALEVGHVQCELLAFTAPAGAVVTGNAAAEERGRERAAAVVQARLAHHARLSRPVSNEATAWVQALLLMLLGYFFSYVSGWSQA